MNKNDTRTHTHAHSMYFSQDSYKNNGAKQKRKRDK